MMKINFGVCTECGEVGDDKVGSQRHVPGGTKYHMAGNEYEYEARSNGSRDATDGIKKNRMWSS
jgi:hypothetical protein